MNAVSTRKITEIHNVVLLSGRSVSESFNVESLHTRNIALINASVQNLTRVISIAERSNACISLYAKTGSSPHRQISIIILMVYLIEENLLFN